MEIWSTVWACVLVSVLVVFAGVTIGGFRDVMDLFASIDKQHQRDETANDNQHDEA